MVRALTDALAFEAFSSEYVAHLIEARSRQLPEASPLVLMRRQDVLELELPPADLSAYSISLAVTTTEVPMAMTDALLAKHLGRLQLPYFAQHHQTLMAKAARESWPHGRFLEQLVVGEVARRDEALVARRVKAARLPGIKTLDGLIGVGRRRSTGHRCSICSAWSSCLSTAT
ncbi:hypothetical protein [Accumulibacter sp.]|uniref:hypothetical protein n=1 Tax=Accumulibacter sp. TaxID=2053492 RepID=UPI002588601A|nr:hypothetical protein [Accumulibacter sp.]